MIAKYAISRLPEPFETFCDQRSLVAVRAWRRPDVVSMCWGRFSMIAGYLVQRSVFEWVARGRDRCIRVRDRIVARARAHISGAFDLQSAAPLYVEAWDAAVRRKRLELFFQEQRARWT